MRRTAYLPPLLRFEDGTAVATQENLSRRRQELRKLACDTFIGTAPEAAPALIGARTLSETRSADGSLRRTVRLTFDTINKMAFDIEVRMPAGKGPFPVFMMVPYGWWSDSALARGYLVCLYPGADGQDAGDLPLKEYPGCTWSRLHRRAWLGSRALDYVLTLPEADQEKVCMSGHSRNGKQTLIAASFDERIKAVVSSSSGTPGGVPYRFASRQAFSEPPDGWPNNWFVDSLKTYVGREHELPIDSHVWFGLIAPRPCLISSAHNDGCESTFAVEQAYLEGRQVYRLLGKPEALRIRWRPGQHHGTVEEDKRMVEGYFDWFDLWFGRGDFQLADFPEEFIHRFDWKGWRENLAHRDLTPPPASANAKARIQWALGQPPEKIAGDGSYTFLTDAESKMMTHDRWALPDTARIPVSFGANVRGNLYHNTRQLKPAPVVVWLHPYSYNSGYNEVYGPGYPGERTSVYHRLAAEGYVVLCFDQCGFGLRLLEGRDFYAGHPQWSRLMVAARPHGVRCTRGRGFPCGRKRKGSAPVAGHRQGPNLRAGLRPGRHDRPVRRRLGRTYRRCRLLRRLYALALEYGRKDDGRQPPLVGMACVAAAAGTLPGPGDGDSLRLRRCTGPDRAASLPGRRAAARPVCGSCRSRGLRQPGATGVERSGGAERLDPAYAG